ncbi:MAG: peptidylprolyl isomerase [Candidatus Amulumruptor caecigallinarius]|nr:peptidylprolyl isomerase [Candidatus Amulumruptor caecigallinarius]MCM1396719.1 peptidylprolyl isomerase [Candidatus Amulumruptor caecigallinarius]MCM1453223.1 peptidylprolyl isomerase [bacterium]
MKRRLLIPLAAVATIAAAVMAKSPSAAGDPVIMTVNGKEVRLSEFEYLYNKNNTQQLEPQTPEQYLEMFINYKLKVADAEAQGLDTTAAFIDELAASRRDLAKPYMTDSATENRLINDIYSHMDRIVDVSHVMLRKGGSPEADDSVKARLDSLRTLIVTGVEPLEVVAEKWSIDPQAKRNKGHMGWMRANAYPYTFEDVAYETPVGSVSEVMETPFGFHIIRVNDIKPDPGKVSVSHIMKMTRGVMPEEAAAAKVAIDSIYELVKNATPEEFADMARRESQDRGTAANGGQLPWFGVGEMVPPFEAAAFAAADGEVTRPVESAFGWHIIMRHDHKGTPSYAEARESILRMMGRDDRAMMAQQAQTDKFVKQYKGTLSDKGIAKVKAVIAKGGTPDSAAVAAISAMTKVEVAKVGKTKITAADIAKHMPVDTAMSVDTWMEIFRDAAKGTMESDAREMAIADLPAQHPDYANLLREYRDGILLFNVSNATVWDKALKDEAGLEKFFEEHRADYAWDKPHFKGIIVFAENDSVALAAHNWLDNNKMADELVPDAIRKEFGRNARAERVLYAKGDNPVVDAIAFDGPVPDLSGNRLKAYFKWNGKVIDQPEEARDVRGAVGADYQNALEKAWIEELRAKYPVTVNRQVLDKVK